MNVELRAPPIPHHRDIAILLRPAGFVEKQSAYPGATAQICQCGDDFIGEILVEGRVTIVAALDLMDEANILATTIIGVTTGEDIHERIDRHVVDVAKVMGIHFHL